jgi:hypothetical protein
VFKLSSLMSLALGGALQPRRKTKRPSLRMRDPNDPYQAARIDAAEAKRARKAEKLQRDTRQAFIWNDAHYNHEDGDMLSRAPNRLNPFYINRSTIA